MSLHLIRNKCVRLDVSLTTTTVHYHTYVIWDNKLLLLPPSSPFIQLWINSWYSTVTAFCTVSSDYKTHTAAKAWHEMGAFSAEDTSDKLGTMVTVVERWGGTQHKGEGQRLGSMYICLCLQSHILICPTRLLDSFDLWDMMELLVFCQISQLWVCVKKLFTW